MDKQYVYVNNDITFLRRTVSLYILKCILETFRPCANFRLGDLKKKSQLIGNVSERIQDEAKLFATLWCRRGTIQREKNL